MKTLCFLMFFDGLPALFGGWWLEFSIFFGHVEFTGNLGVSKLLFFLPKKNIMFLGAQDDAAFRPFGVSTEFIIDRTFSGVQTSTGEFFSILLSVSSTKPTKNITYPPPESWKYIGPAKNNIAMEHGPWMKMFISHSRKMMIYNWIPISYVILASSRVGNL